MLNVILKRIKKSSSDVIMEEKYIEEKYDIKTMILALTLKISQVIYQVKMTCFKNIRGYDSA